MLCGGCSYGARAGVETVVYATGPVVMQAVATGYAGFGSTSRGTDVASDSYHFTLTGRIGTEAREGGVAAAGLGGLEWLHVREENGRWGYHFGIEAGVSGRGADTERAEFLAQARGGPTFRLGTRRWAEGLLLNLGLDATIGVANALNPRVTASAFVAGFALTFAFTDVHRAHL